MKFDREPMAYKQNNGGGFSCTIIRFVSYTLCFSGFLFVYLCPSGLIDIMPSSSIAKTGHSSISVQYSSNISLHFSSTNQSSDGQLMNQGPVINESLDGQTKASSQRDRSKEEEEEVDVCEGKYIYMYDLPSRFNDDLLKHCHNLYKWFDMCQYMKNSGFGEPLNNTHGVFSDSGWFNTNQFTLSIIFHNRMKRYKCLTNDSSKASATYVPYYAGLDVGRYLWTGNFTLIDRDSLDLIHWLQDRPEWKYMSGKDHFLVEGRVTIDFRRVNKHAGWGNQLFVLPQSKAMTTLIIESSPYHDNDFAVPYPTYFHPSTHDDIVRWQDRMRRLERPHLFSFVGAPRPSQKGSIRSEIIDQCGLPGSRCKRLNCAPECDHPATLMKLFQESVFCLQPPGDTWTRKSVFDSMLAGCIPVFFHPGSAYVQYLWHLLPPGGSYAKYSVYIPSFGVKNRTTSIEEILERISDEEVAAKREEVIRLIPRFLYADYEAKLETTEDAFDIAVKNVLERIEGRRKKLKEEGKNSVTREEYIEKDTWKHRLFGDVKNEQWDSCFSGERQCMS